MTRFEVWAPRASRVDLVLGDERHPMARRSMPHGAERGGRWELAVDGCRPGTRYGFSLDGGPPLPDPRARALPDGPDGLGEVVVLEHRWSDDAWQPPAWEGAVVVEIHVGTATAAGTFAAAAELLPALADLGATHVELMPVAPFPGRRGWGYDGVHWWGVHHAYGSPDDLSAFVDAAHRQGLAVLLDVVHNHLGPEGSVLDRFGPYHTDAHRTPWGAAINLDGPGSDEVRREILDAVRMWFLDHHLDGLRLDATHELRDDRAVHLLDELVDVAAECSATVGRPLVLTAENDRHDPALARRREDGGHGLDAVWADDLHHSIHAVLTGERLGYYADWGAPAQIADVLRHGFGFRDTWSPSRGRHHGDDPADLPDSAFVVSLQNHDQVGNRAAGERISHLVGIEHQMAAAALVLTSPFVVLLFQGEHWAASTPFPYFAQHRDPDLVAAVRAGRRREFEAFGWPPETIADPEDPDTALGAVLRWGERRRDPHRLVDRWYRSLLDVRQRHRITSRHDTRAAVIGDATVVVTRGDLFVAANLAPRDGTSVDVEVPWAVARPPLATARASRHPGEGWRLAGGSAIVVERR